MEPSNIFIMAPKKNCYSFLCDFDNTMAIDTPESSKYWNEESIADTEDASSRKVVADLISKRTELMIPSASISAFSIIGILTARFEEDLHSIQRFTDVHFPWASNVPVFTRSSATAHLDPVAFKVETFKHWEKTGNQGLFYCGLIDDNEEVVRGVAKAMGRDVTSIPNVPISVSEYLLPYPVTLTTA